MGRRTRSGFVALSSRARSWAGSRSASCDVIGLKLKPASGGGGVDAGHDSLPSATAATISTMSALTARATRWRLHPRVFGSVQALLDWRAGRLHATYLDRCPRVPAVGPRGARRLLPAPVSDRRDRERGARWAAEPEPDSASEPAVHGPSAGQRRRFEVRPRPAQHPIDDPAPGRSGDQAGNHAFDPARP